MARTWPSFVTSDLDTTTASGSAEMQRRWEIYDREMRALIAAGGVHQDADGWWIDTATGELFGPDPEIERPRLASELDALLPLDAAQPDLAQGIRRSRGRPPLERPKRQVTLRLDADLVDRLRESGPGWQSRVNETLKKSVGL